MAGPLYLCAHRQGSTLDGGLRTAPSGCSNGRFDPSVQFNGVAGNCSGAFSAWPACGVFSPSLETDAGRRYWAMQEPVLEKPFAFRIPTLAEAFKSNVRFSDSAVASALARVRAESEKMLAIIR